MMKKFILALISMSLLLASGCAHIEEYDTEETADTEETTEVQTVTVDNLLSYTRFKNDGISINVYNWGEYIPDGSEEGVLNLNAEFTKLTGITVNYSTYATNEELYAKLKGGGSTYDIIIPSDYMISRMIKENMLEPLDKSNIPNFANIMDKFKSSEYDPGSKYSVPYTWGTVGIIYNVQKLEELGVPAPTKWSDLWDERLKGEILMQDSVRDAFMVALKELGYSMNTTDVGELEEAKKLLLAQKPLVQAYVVDQVRDKMLNGEAAVGVIYSGELLYLQEEAETLDLDYDLEYVLPKEGTNLWIDSWVIPDNAKNKENAEKWINFLCRPDIAVKNFEYITYATPNKAAFEILDPEYQENKSVFPDTDELENSEVYSYLGTEADDLYNALWKEVKSQ